MSKDFLLSVNDRLFTVAFYLDAQRQLANEFRWQGGLDLHRRIQERSLRTILARVDEANRRGLAETIRGHSALAAQALLPGSRPRSMIFEIS